VLGPGKNHVFFLVIHSIEESELDLGIGGEVLLHCLKAYLSQPRPAGLIVSRHGVEVPGYGLSVLHSLTDRVSFPQQFG
jgi:hypothetical protein